MIPVSGLVSQKGLVPENPTGPTLPNSARTFVPEG